nr:unnamed protein product [Callosobruchus chinensis]
MIIRTHPLKFKSFLEFLKQWRPVDCSRCGKKFKNAPSLRTHQNQQCGVEAKYQCDLCESKFKSICNLKRHKARKHTFTELLDIEKMTDYSLESSLARHLRHECGTKRYFCNECKRSYKHKRHIASHIRYECRKEPTFQCTVCTRKFYQRYTLYAHLRQIHMISTEDSKYYVKRLY